MKHSKVLVLFLAISFAFVLSGVAQQQAEETVTCPVSGKEIKKSEAKGTFEYKGETYYFCCVNCKEAFMKDPEKYTQKKAEMKEVYSCPMHPEVKSDKSGKCPKCGMKLEKKMMAMKHMHGEEKIHSKMMHMHGEEKMHKKVAEKMHKKCEEKACCPMMGVMGSKDIEVNVENLEDGVAVKITSKNADVVKKIQKGVVKMKEMCKQKAATCKKEVKKEKVKK
jgi:YHS domain-containing protein